MAATPSTMRLELGTSAPPFELPAIDGRTLTLDDLQGPHGLLVIFACNHCPYVLHVTQELARLADEVQPRGVAVVAINSNDPEAYPADSFERMQEFAAQHGWRFPYLFDETQRVARAYGAACTPDFFLFDGSGHLVYRGQLDSSRPGRPEPVTGADLRAAITALLAGQPPISPQRPSLGCNIKWRPGNEPEYVHR